MLKHLKAGVLVDQNIKQFRDTNYYVSTNGDIYRKNIKYVVKLNHKIMRDNNYSRRRLHINGHQYTVSRMVYECFKGKIPKGYVIVHSDGCCTNDNITNLLIAKKEDARKYCKYDAKAFKIIDLRNGNIYRGIRNVSRKYMYSRYLIKKICEGKKKAPPHLNFAYYDDISGKGFRGNYREHFRRYESI